MYYKEDVAKLQNLCEILRCRFPDNFNWSRRVPKPKRLLKMAISRRPAYFLRVVGTLTEVIGDNMTLIHDYAATSSEFYFLLISLLELCTQAEYTNPNHICNLFKCLPKKYRPSRHIVPRDLCPDLPTIVKNVFYSFTHSRYDLFDIRKNNSFGLSEIRNIFTRLTSDGRLDEVIFLLKHGYSFPNLTLSGEIFTMDDMSDNYRSLLLMENQVALSPKSCLRGFIFAHIEATPFPILKSARYVQIMYITKMVRDYEEAVPELAHGYDEPRSLKHLSRCAVRHQLFMNFNLPEGIKDLLIPDDLKTYLHLTEDQNYCMKDLM